MCCILGGSPGGAHIPELDCCTVPALELNKQTTETCRLAETDFQRDDGKPAKALSVPLPLSVPGVGPILSYIIVYQDMHACTRLANRCPSRLVRSEIVAFSSPLRLSPGRSWLARLGYRLVCDTRRRAGIRS